MQIEYEKAADEAVHQAQEVRRQIAKKQTLERVDDKLTRLAERRDFRDDDL